MRRETVYTDERLPGVQVRWCGGSTFNVWVPGDWPGYHAEFGFVNTDCFTYYVGPGCRPPTPEQAVDIVQERFDEMVAEREED